MAFLVAGSAAYEFRAPERAALFYEFKAKSPSKGTGVPRAPFDWARFVRRYGTTQGVRNATEEDWFEEEEFVSWYMRTKSNKPNHDRLMTVLEKKNRTLFLWRSPIESLAKSRCADGPQ